MGRSPQALPERVNALFAGRGRNRPVERLKERAIEEREDEVIAAARLIETDPGFIKLRAISEEVDRLAAETAARHLR